MKIRYSLAAMLIVSSFSVVADEVPDTTVYNCDAEETISFIKKSTPAFYAPTAVPTTAEAKASYIEAKQAEGGEACLSILTDGTFSDEWERIVENIRNSDFNLPSFDPDIGALYQLMKTAVEEQLKQALDDLADDICQFMSKDNLERLALNAIARETGVRARQLSIESFAGEIQDLVYDSADEDMQMLMSKRKMKREVSSATRRELRQVRRDLWDNL